MSSTVQTELAAMRKVASTLDALDQAARERVIQWAVDRFSPVHSNLAEDTQRQEQRDAPAD